MKTYSAAVALFLSFGAWQAGAQSFSSGSTGADGALDLSAMACVNCSVQLPPSGILNYTTVNVSSGKNLFFVRNLQNTPVVLLAQGNVTIAGAIDVSQFSARVFGTSDPAPYRLPGPGGFYGGAITQPGFGPGGGAAPFGSGKWIGPLSLVPIIGGSGGGGSNGGQCYCITGGGGGGAIVIASSGSITMSSSGSVTAAGGGNPCDVNNGCGGGAGAGGAIRLVANSISAAGSFNALGAAFLGSPAGGPGVIRIEAPAGSLSFTGSAQPAAVLSTINPAILSPVTASLSIVSVGGYPVPSYAGQRFDTVDLLLPSQLPDPIDVVVAASNIPVGTQIQISFGTTNSGTVTPGTLSGSTQTSSATAQVSGLNRTKLAYLFVYATFAVPQSASLFNPAGVDHVAQVHVTAAPGAAPSFSFLRSDGSKIDANRLPSEFLRHFRS
jgi:hypothetical protein